jgi:hypothetical protein
MATSSLPKMIELTPLSDPYRVNPYEILADLRARCPVYREEGAKTFFLTRYADVKAVSTDNSLWRDPIRGENARERHPELFEPGIARKPRSEITSILLLDDPDHERLRRPLAQALHARVASFRPQLQDLVERTLDEIDPSEPFDVMSKFCVQIPIDAIASLLGVGHDRLGEFREWSEGLVHRLNPFRTSEDAAKMERAGAALSAYFSDIIEIRRTTPRDDLISDMLKLQAESKDVSDTELRINLTTLLVAGNLTTTDLMGNAIWLLLSHPEQLARYRSDPSLLNAMVEEALRCEPPVDVTGRIASHELSVGGVPIRTGQTLTLSLRAANRDPLVFDNPNRFDISRERKPHVSFGGGKHLCVGARLARLEAQIALGALFNRFPMLKLADPSAPLSWRKIPQFRGLTRLMVRA